ncbi:MAG TPA: carboxylesterase family protein, partial [Steroidobacteraceae bacterium]|nr:carboxylesterase family protein [Steroidobacteraceae bacterium]
MSKLFDASHFAMNRRALLRSALLTGVVATLPRQLFANSSSALVETASGKLQGAENNGIKIFKGVQYGAPPEGRARFKAPQPVAKWAGVKDALEYGHSAPQGASLIRTAPARGTGLSLEGENPTFSEDCLYLNVWTPGLDNSKRPVLVWLHGGGWSTGSGASILYDGTNMARTQDVVVLTINHRLNVFGYLDLSEIAGKEYADSSCAGLHDVVLALKWVKENISRFGGDPGNVTIFGESGGGRKVSAMMAFPPAQGLFHRAVVESGSALRMDSKEV